MKTILFLITISLSSFLFSQTIVPLNTSFENIPDNGYVKDTQNQLNPFEGTWVFQQGSKKVTIKLEKLIYYNDSGLKKYYIDIIKGRYKVENGTTVVYNDLNEITLTGDISGSLFNSEGYYKMSYWDENECRLLYRVKIKLNPFDSNKLIWEMAIAGIVAFDFEDECQRKYDDDWGTISTLPVSMILTRQ